MLISREKLTNLKGANYLSRYMTGKAPSCDSCDHDNPHATIEQYLRNPRRYDIAPSALLFDTEAEAYDLTVRTMSNDNRKTIESNDDRWRLALHPQHPQKIVEIVSQNYERRAHKIGFVFWR